MVDENVCVQNENNQIVLRKKNVPINENQQITVVLVNEHGG